MSSIRSKDTRPERVVRSTLHALGYRFRVHRKDLPGKPDIVLSKWKTVVLIHGCFWHGCRVCDRGTRIPKTNTEFWLAKVAENRERDVRNIRDLEGSGWYVIVVWACETKNIPALGEKLNRGLRGRVKSARP